jgi:hypothetical protein
LSEVFGLEFETPEGERLYFEWNPESLAHLEDEPSRSTPWQLDGQLDWDEIELIRILSARFEDHRLLGVAALRPAGAEGHGQEVVVAVMVDAEGNASGFDETLLSVEYAAGGLPRRVGLELYRSEGSIPLRVAGNATATDSAADGALERTSANLDLRLTGCAGRGRLDLLRRA